MGAPPSQASYDEIVVEFSRLDDGNGAFDTLTTVLSMSIDGRLQASTKPARNRHFVPFLVESTALNDLRLADLARIMRGSRADLRYSVSTNVQIVGACLFNMVFGDALAPVYDALLKVAREDSRKRARIRLVFGEDASLLSLLPWEAMYDERSQDFVTLLPNVSIYRGRVAQTASNGERFLEIGEPAESLLLISTDTADGRFQSDRELDVIEKIAESQGIRCVRLRSPSAATLQRAIGDTKASMLFLCGHVMGRSEAAKLDASLALPSQDGGFIDLTHAMEAALPAGQLVDAIRGNQHIRFVYLDACNSGQIAPLLLPFVSAAIGVQGLYKVENAIAFAERFYEALFDGTSLEMAVAYARRRVDREFPGDGDWALPALFANNPSASLRLPGRESTAPSSFSPAMSDADKPEILVLRAQQRIREANLGTLSMLIRDSKRKDLEAQRDLEQKELNAILAAIETATDSGQRKS